MLSLSFTNGHSLFMFVIPPSHHYMFPVLISIMMTIDNVDAMNSCDASIDGICSSTPDKAGYEAIRWLHRQLDDDANGNVDITETDGVSYDDSHLT